MWLIGMMGSGKSTVGRLAAERLGVPFYDTDAMVEERAGLSIAEIWANSGEPAFREMEAEAVASVPPAGVMAAAGGGAVLEPANRRVISRAREIVWLRSDVATLAGRLETTDDRPLLAGSSTAVLTSLLDDRAPLYAALATHVVDTAGVTIPQVVDEVAEIWPR